MNAQLSPTYYHATVTRNGETKTYSLKRMYLVSAKREATKLFHSNFQVRDTTTAVVFSK